MVVIYFVLIQAKLKEVASLEGHVLLKKLRDALEALRGRIAGQNKDDVEKAISMVSLKPIQNLLYFSAFIKLVIKFATLHMNLVFFS